MTSALNSTEPPATLANIVASFSRMLELELDEVQAVLTQWLALARQDKMTCEWPTKLEQALVMLPQATTVPQFIAQLTQAGV